MVPPPPKIYLFCPFSMWYIRIRVNVSTFQLEVTKS